MYSARKLRQQAFDVFHRFCSPVLSVCAKRYLAWDAEQSIRADWGHGKQPLFFKHEANLYRWRFRPEEVEWVERGMNARQYFFPGCRVLDLCCGDGSYPYLFYADIAGQVDAVDSCTEALAYAEQHFSHPRVRYHRRDVLREPFPSGAYDVAIINGGLAYFSEGEQKQLLAKLPAVLGSGGVFVGTTPMAAHSGKKHTVHHAREFASEVELRRLLLSVFSRVDVRVTHWVGRTNLVFICRS